MTRALRVRCSRCLAAPGAPCRSLNRRPHVVRVLDGRRAAKAARQGHVSVSAAAYEQIKAEAKARGVSMPTVVKERIAKLTGKEIA